jgi:hypothetical protein
MNTALVRFNETDGLPDVFCPGCGAETPTDADGEACVHLMYLFNGQTGEFIWLAPDLTEQMIKFHSPDEDDLDAPTLVNMTDLSELARLANSETSIHIQLRPFGASAGPANAVVSGFDFART